MRTNYKCQFLNKEGFAFTIDIGFFPANDCAFMFFGHDWPKLRSKKSWEMFLRKGIMQDGSTVENLFVYIEHSRQKCDIHELLSMIEHNNGRPLWSEWNNLPANISTWRDDEDYAFHADTTDW